MTQAVQDLYVICPTKKKKCAETWKLACSIF